MFWCGCSSIGYNFTQNPFLEKEMLFKYIRYLKYVYEYLRKFPVAVALPISQERYDAWIFEMVSSRNQPYSNLFYPSLITYSLVQYSTCSISYISQIMGNHALSTA